jgi:hypothetical protein
MITYIDTQHIEGQRTPTPGCLESMVENCNPELIPRNLEKVHQTFKAKRLGISTAYDNITSIQQHSEGQRGSQLLDILSPWSENCNPELNTKELSQSQQDFKYKWLGIM